MPDFTSDQLHAIGYLRQDACVVAGPGSGKTTVLVERFRSLIEDYRFDPRPILAITFTEKAAANMKAKLAELFAHDPLRLRELESAWVSTIHGFCARLLRDHALAAGIDPRFSVLDARESEEWQYACLNAALDELAAQRRPEALALIEALQNPHIAGDLRNAWDGIRSAGKTVAEARAMPCPTPQASQQDMSGLLRGLLANWTGRVTAKQQSQHAELLEWAERLAGAGPGDLFPLISGWKPDFRRIPADRKPELTAFRETLRAWAIDRHTAPFRAIVFDVLQRFDELYTERKTAVASLDFNDLERCTIGLLTQNEDVRARVRAQFRQIMLDEFQDINEQQAELIRLVRADDVFFGVGDVNQSIYGFRHARPEIFNAWREQIRESGKHSAELLHNFRSRAAILRGVETLLHGAEGIDPRALVAGAGFSAKPEPSIEVLQVHDDDRDESAAKEARSIAYRILALRGTLQLGAEGETRHADFADFAVLCRNGESMKPILEAFGHANIPYVCGRRQSFLLSREGLDITALLHTIANPRDAIALATVLRSPLAGIGDEALLRVRLLAGSLPGGLNLLAHDFSKFEGFAPEDARKLERFIGNLKRWRAEQPVVPLQVLLVRMLSDCGFAWMPGTVAGDNVESFLHLARTRGEERGLFGLLREIESLQKAVNLESDLSDEDQGNRVQVMTAHSAKGLEFPVTIIAAMDKGTQRNSAPATFTPRFGLGLSWKDPGGKPGGAGLADSWQIRNAEYLSEREKHEAHRLLYVAMTRAEEHLILSYSRGKRPPQNWAKRVEDLLPSDESRIDTLAAPNGETFEVSVRVVDGEPPVPRAWSEDAVDSEPVLTLPRPSVDGQHNSAVNVTSLAVFAECPRKYYLQRYIGWSGTALPGRDGEGAVGTTLSAADLGSLVHEILAAKPGVYPPALYPEEAQRLANSFLGSDLGARAAAAVRSAREWDFIADIDGTLVSGTVDLWFEESDGEIVIVDYKTDSVKASEAARRAESYAPQLALYGLALERALARRPAHAWLHFLRPDTQVEVPLDDASFSRVKRLLAELRDAQNALRFELREGEHCRTCQYYRGPCPAVL